MIESFFSVKSCCYSVSLFCLTDLFSLFGHLRNFVLLCFIFPETTRTAKTNRKKTVTLNLSLRLLPVQKVSPCWSKFQCKNYCIFHKHCQYVKCMLILPIIIVTVKPVIYFCTFLTSNSVSLYILLPLFRPAVFGLHFRRELSLFVIYTFLVPTCGSSHLFLNSWNNTDNNHWHVWDLMSLLTFLKLYRYCTQSLTRKMCY